MLSSKALTVANRMAEGEVFYSRLSPRLSPIIRDELRSHGLALQSESPRHESTFYYPLHLDEFKIVLANIKKCQSIDE